MQWLDLRDPGGARLKFAIHGNTTWLTVFGITPERREWQLLVERLGYRPSLNRKYLMREASGQRVTVSEYAAIFPNTIKREFARDQIEVQFQSRQPQGAQPAAHNTVPATPARPVPRMTQQSINADAPPASGPLSGAPGGPGASATPTAPASGPTRLTGTPGASGSPPRSDGMFSRLAQFSRTVESVPRATPGATPAAPAAPSSPAPARLTEPGSPRQRPVSATPPARPAGDTVDTGATETEQTEAQADAQAVATDDGAARCWGRNAQGDMVYEGAFGRYFLREADQVQVNETDLPLPMLFLRTRPDPVAGVEDLMGCADGFVRSMRLGEVQYQDDLERLCEAMYGDRATARVAITRGAVEEAMTRALRSEFEVPHDAWDAAVQMYERLPEARVGDRGRAALPLPMAVAAQWLAGDTRDKTVAIPQAWDGALASVLVKDSHIRARRVDAASGTTSGMSSLALSPDIEWLERVEDIYERRAQVLIFNADPAPIGPIALDGSVGHADGAGGHVAVDRADYLQAAQQLALLDEGGRAVLVLAGEDPLNPGAILSNGARQFYDWLEANFTLNAAFETNAELQRRSGTDTTLRLIALEKRVPSEASQDEPERAAQADAIRLDRFLVLHDWDAVRDHLRDAIREHHIEEAQSEGISVERETAENLLQVPYQAAARLGEARTMVPKNMFGALNEKFTEIASLYGPVENIVGRGLNLSPAELAERFSPEQVDAIALSMLRVERDNRGIIVGDDTGIGKGRAIAALASWACQQQRKVIFITRGSDLFSDLVRDLKDAQVWDSFSPFLVNAEATLVDVMGDRSILARGTPVDEMRAILSSGTTLDELGRNLVFATYSQFSGKDSLKAKWLLDQCDDALVVVDESHEAAGSSSNVANFVELLTTRSWGVIYSSATWAKTVDNISIYRRAFPPQVNVETLRDTMRRGGEGFMETFSTMLAREGALVRREHDMSRLVVDVRVDEQRLAQNERISDQVSEVLGAMAFVAGETNRLFRHMNAGANDILVRARDQRNVIVEMIEGQARERSPTAEERALQVQEQASLRQALSRMRVARLQFNLGTNLYQTIRRVEAALTAQYTADLAIEALQDGRKPVIVFEDTNEALVRRMIGEARAELVREAERNGTPLTEVPKVTEIPTPTVKHMLRSLARSLGVVSWTNALDLLRDDRRPGGGTAAPDADDAAVVHGAVHGADEGHAAAEEAAGDVQLIDEIEGLPAEFVTSYREGMTRIMEAIDALPDIPIIGADIVRDRLTQEGYRVAEVSGRVITAVDQGDGTSRLVGRSNSKKVVTKSVAAFNDGEADAMLINRAGAAGISLHASPRFIDTRQRHLFELQIPNNVSDRIQLFGRVNRYDQVSFPLVTGVSSGLYASLRQLMMQNNKVRKLSANTRSSRNSAYEDKRIPDLLNVVGREAAYEFLQDNPGMMLRLGLDVSILSDDQASYLDFADVVMKRVPLLKVAEQRRVYEELASRFDDIMMRAEMKGENPLRAQEIPFQAKQGDRRIVTGIEVPGQSIFDAPVYISEIIWEQEIQPVRWERVAELVKGGRSMLTERGVADVDNRYALDVSAGGLDVSAYAQRVGRMFDAMARISLQASGHDTVEAALAGQGYNAVKRTVERATWFANVATKMLPGSLIGLQRFAAEEKERYMVVNWSLPGQNREINLDQYRVQLVRPGDTNPFELTLATLFSYGDDLEVYCPDVYRPDLSETEAFELEHARAAFENAPAGRILRSRKILDGNLYAASELAAENKLGSGVIFTDEQGVRRRAVLLNTSVSDFNMEHLPRAISQFDMLRQLGQRFASFGIEHAVPLHLSLRDSLKRKGNEVIYFVEKDGRFQWQWQMQKTEVRRFQDKLKLLEGHELTIGQGIHIQSRRRDTTLVFSDAIELLEPALKARGVESLYLTRLDYRPVHEALDVMEVAWRDEQVALRAETLRQREAELAEERARAEAEEAVRAARSATDVADEAAAPALPAPRG
jgi:hypothetical protein